MENAKNTASFVQTAFAVPEVVPSRPVLWTENETADILFHSDKSPSMIGGLDVFSMVYLSFEFAKTEIELKRQINNIIFFIKKFVACITTNSNNKKFL